MLRLRAKCDVEIANKKLCLTADLQKTLKLGNCACINPGGEATQNRGRVLVDPSFGS